MLPVDMARVPTREPHRELLRDAERRRLIAVVPGRPVAAAPAYEPSAT